MTKPPGGGGNSRKIGWGSAARSKLKPLCDFPYPILYMHETLERERDKLLRHVHGWRKHYRTSEAPLKLSHVYYNLTILGFHMTSPKFKLRNYRFF